MGRIGVVLLLCAVSAASAQPARRWSPDELLALSGVGGFGSTGVIDTSTEQRAPGNTLGFSLGFDWSKHGTDPGWWSIRMGLPRGARLADYDTLAFDVRAEPGGTANLKLFLYEPDDNRWVAWDKPLAELADGAWRHVETRRESMSLWKLSANAEDWNAIHGLALEPNNGTGIFYLDNLCLKGPGGRVLPLVDLSDDGLVADPAWHEPLPKGPPPVGTVYFPHDGARIGDKTMRDSALGLHQRLGQVGVPMSGYGPTMVAASRELRAAGVSTLYYASMGGAYRRYFTRRGAWDENLAGRSLNALPGSLTNWDWQHMYAMGHPAVFEAQKQRVDALLKAGMTTWMVVDYTFPWQDGPWGYSQANVDAFRADLLDRDEGLMLRWPNSFRAPKPRLSFAGYFRHYLGFDPSPAQFGLARWEDWTPPRPADPAQWQRSRQVLFMLLRSFEWLKLPDRVGRYYRDQGGQPLWIIPNPEDTGGSSDYQFMLRSQGVGNLFPEWFGPIGWAAEATYASLPGLRETADAAGTRLSIIHETGAGGHSSPYLDWRVAYTGVYAITASGRLDDFDNDFLDEHPQSVLDKPESNAYHFNRYREGVGKAMAFRQARADRARRGEAEIVCIGERPPARACGSPYFTLNQPHSLGVGLSRAHLLFDWREQSDVGLSLDLKRMVVYNPWALRSGDVERWMDWLGGGPGRVFVTHSFVPTRDTTGFWGLTASSELGDRTTAAGFGLGRITAGEKGRVTITEAPEAWGLRGRSLELTAPLCRASQGEPVVMTDRGPLVYRVRRGGGTLYYLAYTPGDSDETQRLDALLMTAIAREAQITPEVRADFDTLVQQWGGNGLRVIAAWDAPAMGKFDWRYEPGIAAMPYEAPGVSRTVTTRPLAAKLAYDFWRDTTTPFESQATLKLDGALCGLWYLASDEAALAPIKAVRAKMNGW